jgi:hypothetical protein
VRGWGKSLAALKSYSEPFQRFIAFPKHISSAPSRRCA